MTRIYILNACMTCGGTGNDVFHPWSEGDNVAARNVDMFAACEACEGTGQ